MDHMKEYWEKEMKVIKQSVSDSDKIKFSSHSLDVRMIERGIDFIDIAYGLLTGSIVEGYDIGRYPRYRNPDPLRTIIGQDSNGEPITIGVALKNSEFVITTCYRGTNERLKHHLTNFSD